MTDITRDDLVRWDREIYWHSFTQMAEYKPFIVERAKGCTLTDIDGNDYLDGVSSLWCNVHGHRHTKIDTAVRQQLDRVAHCTSLGASNPQAIKLAKRLADISPEGLNHVYFADSGSTAVEAALKIAFQYWCQCESPQPQKTKYIALGDGYHGDTIGSVSVGGVAQFHKMFHPLLFEVLRLRCPETYRLPEGVTAENACEYYLAEAEALLKEHHQETAAFVLEPLVQGAAGIITHPTGYLRGIRELTKKYNVLLIADEVAVGVGRTGKMFACEQEDVSPDILCLAKGISGGYLPLAATLVTSEIYNAFLGSHEQQKTFFHGHTYAGNPLAAAAALATLDIFEEEQTLTKLPEKIKRISEHLCQIAEHPHVGDTRQRGMIVGIELVQSKAKKEPYPWNEKRGSRVCEHALKNGVWIRPLGNVVIGMPALSMRIDEIDLLFNTIEQGIDLATRD